ncbi:hypothetical protein D3C80_1685770 [compost metagenome]
MQTATAFSAIEALDHEAVMITGIASGDTGRDSQATMIGQGIHHQFPSANVIVIAGAGELGNPQVALLVCNAGLGAGATQ